jgi:hypothetical protein
MRQHRANLNESDLGVYRTTFAFLVGRLEEPETVDWGLRLKPLDEIRRMVVLDLLDRRKISEPWQTAWRLIEESWNNPVVEDHASAGVYDAKHRLQAGDRSGSLVTAIVDCVAPKLKVEPFSRSDLHFRKPPKRAKKIDDIFSSSLSSGKIVDPNLLDLETLTDRFFLFSLALALDTAVSNGLDIARRIGRDVEQHFWQIGELNRVYYVHSHERANEEDEPDEFHRGIAPSVKLLHAVVLRLVDVDIAKAIEFVGRWKLSNLPVHLRLWAALSRDPRVTPANEVSNVLLSLDNRHFWELHDFPEVAELRARRFSEFDPQKQADLTTRIRKYPPPSRWPRKADPNKIKNAQLYWAVRELQRIEIAGATLPQPDQAWLVAKIHEFPDLLQMARIDEGFPGSPKGGIVPPNPDNRYNLLVGEERLKSLEAALSSTRDGWADDPARGARDWIRQQGNPVKVLADFESIPDGGTAFPRIWERFGLAHSLAAGQGEDGGQRDLQSECARVLSLLAKLSEGTVRQAINGISHWLYTWEKQVVFLPEGLTVWLKFWPIAVETTNKDQPTEEEVTLNTVAHFSDDREPMDLDTLNTPAGKLVGVFLAACPNLQGNGNPFDSDDVLRMMRDVIIATTGRSGLISRHRMIEALPYFLNADSDWTHEYLIMPLNADDSAAIALWRAIGRQIHYSDVLKIIGNQMTDRATDQRLGRETRRSLVFSLVIECLYAFQENRDPAVSYPRIQQMIRSLDYETRAYGAEAIQRFLHDLSSPGEGRPTPPSPEELFRSSAAPFLQQVWPQESSLTTPGISRAFADLPAATKEAFAEAVDTIERFLVPFECWSMLEYGLYGEQDGQPKLSIIDNQEKATALLRLLDLTIGRVEGSVIPHDLGDALDQIRRITPSLANNQVFRRLATAARRG